MPDERPWWQTAVFYQLYPRSFADSDGDGVGDLAGAIGRLPYLRRLGVDAVWVCPFYPSPQRDFGYDVTDHRGVDPVFGTVADAERLIRTAHDLGLRVVIDFIPNHTSDEHPWFVESRDHADGPKRDWYYWRDGSAGRPPTNWLSLFGGSAWTWDAGTRQYYLHSYLEEQPDLNWRNPAVRAAMDDVLRCWLDRGVDGFRIDAFRQLLKDPHWRDNPVNPDWPADGDPYHRLVPLRSTDQDDIVMIIDELRGLLRDHPRPPGGCHPGDRVLLAEAYLPIPKLVRYHGTDGDGLQLPSNMNLLTCPWQPRAVAALIEEYEELLPPGGWPNWLLGNHDRSRVATRLGHDQQRIAALLLLTLRGTPILYYGEELGLPDVDVPEAQVRDPVALRTGRAWLGRDPARMPMPWTRAARAGFCAEDIEPWLPLRPDAAELSVESQQDDPASTLTLYRRILALRRGVPALSAGSYSTLRADDRLLSFRRGHEAGDAVVALNFSDQPVRYDLPADRSWRLELASQHGGTSRLLRPHEGHLLLSGQNGKA
ncbi:alpha-amylase family glycosyl hydrolase [Microlunatus parietis]|uniref:Alpha-glucosidase n=1 Tax=Microlunatus parietis TaxID=682979 RepID=A0A7Y9I5D3_9ACTN|nr:alpha-amylase family glycosyl hydrolase [Microlunatus parietis]NYE70584.1 alpha-glucosidase [Microlunatus parietis]